MKDNVTEYATVSIAPDVVGSEHADNSSILLGKEGSDMARLTLRRPDGSQLSMPRSRITSLLQLLQCRHSRKHSRVSPSRNRMIVVL